ncbi:alpha-2-macroglobulin family protein [Spirosoma oryzicola]|uniref:alpha-2-macroglobulin family protein n=1 Tax=Spirosoma oryzicola TaxID=2898794 RepID=UPI001E62B47B|nr:alpha-2-macroglobulin family protein [Spirosoma oryzicola]UHG91296.1 carboxypeptidase-like regulatory domain-containing protein [Spirosoma oryzicola]
MNPILTLFFVFVALAASAQKNLNTPANPPDYARDWKRADSLAAKGLPKSALSIANRIYKEAKTTRNYPQLAKAAMHRMIFRSYSDEDAYVELVQSIEADIRDTPEPSKSVLGSVLADVYWQYFQQNRYKFYNRTPISQPTSKRGKQGSVSVTTTKIADTTADFRTWDAQRLVGAVTQLYLASVQQKNLLQKTPIAAFDALLDKGDADTRPLRPTLYDLLAHRAISFFENTEPDLLKPIFKFELNQPDYFANADAFAKLTIQSRDSLSGRYQALRLYQHLLAFHLTDANPIALADADALRLAFVYQHSVVPNKDSLYRQTLDQQIVRYKNQPAEAIYGYQLAQFLVNQGQSVRPLDDTDSADDSTNESPYRWNKKQAADICRDLIKRFPATTSSQQASVLLNRLLQSSFSLQVEQVNAPEQAFRALVSYQNASKITYRIVRLSVTELETSRINMGEDSQQKKYTAWLKRPVVAEKSVMLPDDGDLNQHTVEIPLAGLPTGQYAVLATSADKFSEKTESVQYTVFSVSKLSYLLQPIYSGGSRQQVIVTNRLTGAPLPNVAVTVVEIERQKATGSLQSRRTDANGIASFDKAEMPVQNAFAHQLTDGSDTLFSDRQYHNRFTNEQAPAQSQTYTKLFTDRAIYRPGQLIYVKGLVYEGKPNQYGVISNREVAIELIDQNGERVSKQTLKTNEFGTFACSFTAPVGKLSGQMSIQTAFGSASIRVEEYKRPTFEVKIDPIKQPFKLGQTVTLTADAKTFSGAVVDGAAVRYRVVRKLQQRWLWYARIGGPRNENQTEIANGTAQTDANGNVAITFDATPDREKSRQDNPVFEFDVTIDVTDRAGETRSATQTLRIGYTALQAELTVPEQVEKDKPVTVPVKITNQAGQTVAAKGQLTIYKLQSPTKFLRNRLWNRPDRQLLSRAEFERLFPNDLYSNENDPRSWKKGPAVQQQAITTPTDSLVKLNLANFTAGEYVAELTVTDSAGEATKDRSFFTVIDEKNPVASVRPEGWLQVRKATAIPGEEAVFWVGTDQSWVRMIVEQDHAVVREEWIKTERGPRRVALPVTEQQRGGFAVHFTMIQNGRLYQKSQVIAVPFTNKQLTIETQTFRNKLKPGQQEEWTLKINGLDNVPAELVATLYDASLDAFAPLEWPTSFYQPYFPVFYGWQSGAFSIQYSNGLRYPSRLLVDDVIRHYDQLSWLGYQFSPSGNRPFVRVTPAESEIIRATVRRVGKVISGTVKFKAGSGVPGVNVLIKGTTTGAVTDEKGQFSISTDSASQDVTLVFSTVGYVTNEVILKQKAVSFQMKPDARSLNEVAVVGYGRTLARKGMVAGAPAEAIFDAAAPASAELKRSDFSQSAVSEPTTKAEPINPRRNFNETAFFIPQVKTDEQGKVVLKFTMPEALTRWRLLAFAHTKDLKTGTLEREIITQKELMITANAPRFFREGDTIRVTARINNLTDKPMSVLASLNLSDALTGEPITQQLMRTSPQTSFSVAAGQGQAVGWTLIVPKGLETVTCRLTAQSGSFTDGEEFTVPVMPNRMLVTDTQPFWVNGSETKEFKLKALTNLNPELPVQHERLTVEVTSNPSWYALQALPYLMEYSYECAEQLFSRLYANSLAVHIVNSKPSFKQVIAEWQKNPPKNPLQANEELRSIALENSPWLADARSEAARQAQLGQLFDQNRMTTDQEQTLEKLRQLQTSEGGFRWFGGMEPSLSMTLHVLGGFGHLQKLGVRFPEALQSELNEMQVNAVRYVDAEMKRLVEEQKKTKANLSWDFSAAQYLYARSFYMDKPVDKALLTYLKQRVADNWLKQSLQGQALSAMALHRFGDTQTADNILRSLLERTRHSDELGTYWPDNKSGMFWYQTPIETQAYLIEAFDEIKQDRTLVDTMKRWLLRQKQTQSWSSTKATTEAVYALLLRGTDWLDTKPGTQVSLGGQPIENRVTKTEAITGYQKVTYAAAEIKPEMGIIQITKKAAGPAWGALYWQHFEPLDRVMPGSAGLSVQKTLYVQHDSPTGPIIDPVTPQTSLKPGDLIKVRLILKTDRAMEYVHLKDGRASGFEPTAALSGYKYQNGLGYYESPRDASTDFFLSYVPVGTHVFEYDLRVAQTGDFSAGVATVQCFYAPEFSAHSAGERVKVKP